MPPFPPIPPKHSAIGTKIAAFSLLGFCTACSPSLQAQSTPSPTASPIAPSTTVVALGKLQPEGEVIKISVANAQDSRVNQILVKEGDTVQANQVIAILQGRDRVEQQLREAQANVSVKQSQLQKTQQGDAKAAEIAAQRATIAEIRANLATVLPQREAAIAEAQATLKNAELTYQRNQSLFQEGAVNRSDLDNAQEALAKAIAAVTTRQSELTNTQATLQAQITKEQANLERLQEVRPVDIDIATAELEQALIQVEQRRAELTDTEVRVPIAGQILRINTRVGEQVNTQEGIAELGQTKQMYAIAEVYETDIIRVKKGQATTITSEYGGFTGELKGSVAHVALQIGKAKLGQDQQNPNTDVNARVVEVKVRLNPADSAKVSTLTGMQVRLKIDTAGQTP
jgi:HlyD family secretion protein